MSRKITIKECYELAKNKNGKCLSKKFLKSRNKLKWQCSKGHIWRASHHKIKIGRWCPKCAGKAPLTMNDFHEIANKHDGYCLSKKYRTGFKLKWQCGKGHIFKSNYTNAKLNWCPECRNPIININIINKELKPNKVKCISKKYHSKFKSLNFRCLSCKSNWVDNWRKLSARKTKCLNCALSPSKKICTKCNVEKHIGLFNKRAAKKDGRRSECRSCCKINRKKSYQLNKKKEMETTKIWHKNQLKTNINYKLKCKLRWRLNRAIRGNCKSGSAVRDLGCSIEYFKKYLETKFYTNPITGEEMSWDNWSRYGWHLDHIKPLSSFDLTNRKEFLEACNYTNMQPLWCFENLEKGNKLNWKKINL